MTKISRMEQLSTEMMKETTMTMCSQIRGKTPMLTRTLKKMKSEQIKRKTRKMKKSNQLIQLKLRQHLTLLR